MRKYIRFSFKFWATIIVKMWGRAVSKRFRPTRHYSYKNSSTDLQLTVLWFCVMPLKAETLVLLTVSSSRGRQQPAGAHDMMTHTHYDRSALDYTPSEQTRGFSSTLIITNEASHHLRPVDSLPGIPWITAVCSYPRGFLFSWSSACLVAGLWPHGRSDHRRSGWDDCLR